MPQTREDQLKILHTLIRSGKLDAYLEDVERAIRTRRTTKGYDLLTELDVGDMIEITNRVKPKMLGHKRATVVNISSDLITVNLVGYLSPKWRPEIPIRLKPSLIGRIVRKADGTVPAS